MKALGPVVALVVAGLLPGIARAQPPAPKPETVASTVPTVTLLDAGQEPRRVLRYRPAVGATQTVTLTLNTDREVDVNGKPTPVRKSPELRLALDVRVVEVTEHGEVRYEAVFRAPEAVATEGMAETDRRATQESLAGMGGTKIRALLTERAVLKESEVEVPDQASPQVRQTLKSLDQYFAQWVVPVPEEAVGIGARWEVHSEPSMMGRPAKNVETYTVLSVEEGVVHLRTEMKQTVTPGPVTLARIPPGTVATLDIGQSEAAGEATVDLSRVVLKKCISQSGGTTELSAKTDDRTMTTRTRMKSRLKIEG